MYVVQVQVLHCVPYKHNIETIYSYYKPLFNKYKIQWQSLVLTKIIIIKHKNESDENVIQIKIIESILYR